MDPGLHGVQFNTVFSPPDFITTPVTVVQALAVNNQSDLELVMVIFIAKFVFRRAIELTDGTG